MSILTPRQLASIALCASSLPPSEMLCVESDLAYALGFSSAAAADCDYLMSASEVAANALLELHATGEIPSQLS